MNIKPILLVFFSVFIGCISPIYAQEMNEFFIFDHQNPELASWGEVNPSVKNFLELNQKAWKEKDLKLLTSLRGYLEDIPEYAPYNRGLEVSILYMADTFGKQDVLDEQTKKLLQMPNAKYVASDGEETWIWGWTHPEAQLWGELPKIQSKAAYLDFLISLIKEYNDDQYWKGTIQTSNQMPYAEKLVEELYFNSHFTKENISTNDKLVYLHLAQQWLSGGSLGNAQYCLSLIYKKLGDKQKALEYKNKCLTTYTNAYRKEPHTHHFGEMIRLCSQ